MDIAYGPADDTDIQPVFSLCKALIDEYENTANIDYDKVLGWVLNKIQTHIREYVCVTLNGNKAAYYYFHHSEGKMELDDLYVLPLYQNMGIGTAILKRCISHTKLPIFLYVFINNKGAVSLYQKLGFRISKTINGSRYIMQRD
ncbi:MAG: GNAT family N-acetyltransferase [Clostridiaceae bacterium]|nr:GNAT family N-acetyltransferase [Clostridiaceae bacterium]